MSAPLRSGQFLDSGKADGFVVKYSSSTEVAITAGYLEANKKLYKLDADTTLAIGGIPAAFTRYYIMIDDGASSPPVPSFTFSATPPTEDKIRRGQYLGDNRIIGTAISRAGLTTLDYCDVNAISDKQIEYLYIRETFAPLARNMDPDGTWQEPNLINTSSLIPVNATRVRVLIFAGDADEDAFAIGGSAEYAAAYPSPFGAGGINFRAGTQIAAIGGFPIGASRNIKIAGWATDDNVLSADLVGFSIAR